MSSPHGPGFSASPRFLAAVKAFEEANASDPNREIEGGTVHPREVLYARRLSEWVARLQPDASEALRLAACCQHLRRWEIPRGSYPMDRPGYLRWRKELQRFHAAEAGKILATVGYEPALIERVQSLNRKEKPGADAELQVLEDALCLVFLQYQFAELAVRTDEEKVVNAIRKSWAKMSPAGREAALRLPFGPRERGLVERALTAGDAARTERGTSVD